MRKGPALIVVTAAALAVAAASVVPAGDAKGAAKGGASLTPEEILERCDTFHFFYSDSLMKVLTVLKDEDGNKTKMAMEVMEKGAKRLILFHEPPDVAGMAVLIKDEDTIYVYEPEFNKVRRIASHAKKQTMLGSDFTFDEMATKKLGVDYEPQLVSEDEHETVLWLSQKPGRDKAWPHIRLTVDKDNHWNARKIQYFDENGKKHKTETRKKVKMMDGYFLPTVLAMVDHGREHSTTNIVGSAVFNQGLSDKIFTKRYLIREE